MEKVHFYAKIDSSPTFKVWVSEKATKFETIFVASALCSVFSAHILNICQGRRVTVKSHCIAFLFNVV